MTKTATRFVCTACGHDSAKWLGRCPGCEAFNTFEETRTEAPAKAARGGLRAGRTATGGSRSGVTLVCDPLKGRAAPPERVSTGHPEFDRALGGGLVEGAVVMIGGAPGMGKSTLLLQAAAHVAPQRRTVYITGEESLDQVQRRARRLGLEHAPVNLIASNDCLAIADHIEGLPPGSVAVVDSLQVMDSGLESAPGSVGQVKAAAATLVPAAKSANVSLILVSHVTKEGSLAGPNIVMHAVDATMHIDMDTAAGIYRLIRSDKNRFGAVGEVGVFEMTETGLVDVANPSELFLSQRDAMAFGTVIYPSMEGSRPLLLEVQALVAPTAFGTGRRSATGWDSGRLNMLLATIATRLGIPLLESDVYVNVAGGLKVTDPAMDLAVLCAILSAHGQTPLPPDLAVFGEVGLAGEVRNAGHAAARLREAAHLGLSAAICPQLGRAGTPKAPFRTNEIRRVAALFEDLPELMPALG